MLVAEHHYRQWGRDERHGERLSLRGNSGGFDGAQITDPATSVKRAVAVDELEPRSGLGHGRRPVPERPAAQALGAADPVRLSPASSEQLTLL